MYWQRKSNKLGEGKNNTLKDINIVEDRLKKKLNFDVCVI